VASHRSGMHVPRHRIQLTVWGFYRTRELCRDHASARRAVTDFVVPQVRTARVNFSVLDWVPLGFLSHSRALAVVLRCLLYIACSKLALTGPIYANPRVLAFQVINRPAHPYEPLCCFHTPANKHLSLLSVFCARYYRSGESEQSAAAAGRNRATFILCTEHPGRDVHPTTRHTNVQWWFQTHSIVLHQYWQ
jgi:hypothetical protein